MRKLYLNPWLTLCLYALLIAGLAWFSVAQNQDRYKKVCAYADAHQGRVEDYTEYLGGETAIIRYRVWLPDGTVITEREINRTAGGGK